MDKFSLTKGETNVSKKELLELHVKHNEDLKQIVGKVLDTLGAQSKPNPSLSDFLPSALSNIRNTPSNPLCKARPERIPPTKKQLLALKKGRIKLTEIRKGKVSKSNAQ
jgi:hypothetical protein